MSFPIAANDLYATSAAVLMTSEHGAEWLNWDPTTINLEFSRSFVEVTPILSNKLNAVATLLASDLFHGSVETFCAICNAFNSSALDGAQFIPADMDDVLWGATEASLLEGVTYRDRDFSHGIELYTGVLLSEKGIYTPPSILSWAKYPTETTNNVSTAFSGSDVEYAAFRATQEQIKKDLEIACLGKTQSLFLQLKTLPIKKMDTTYLNNIVNKLEVLIKEA